MKDHDRQYQWIYQKKNPEGVRTDRIVHFLFSASGKTSDLGP
jgi:hypothetical protein